MDSSPEATVFTNTILSAVRLQRHLGARIIVSTQEPTISPTLLSLCSVTIVHRFTSPEWLRILRGHLAAAAAKSTISPGGKTVSMHAELSGEKEEAGNETSTSLFDKIVRLRVGEALLFAPSAIIGISHALGNDGLVVSRLGGDHLAVTIRARLTADGGKSILSLS